MTLQRFGVKEVAEVTLYDLGTGLPSLYLDTLKMSDIDNKATTTFAQGGRGNPRLLAWDFDKQIQLKVQDALISLASLAVLAGNSIVTGVQNIFIREVLTCTDTTNTVTVTLSQTPVNTTSLSIWTTNDGGKTQATQVTGVTTTGTSATFSDTQGAITLATGDQVIAFYQYASGASSQSLTFTSDQFAGYYQLVGDTVFRNEVDGVDYPAQIVIPKAKVENNFTLTLRPDGNPSVLDFTLDVFKEAASTDMMIMNLYSAV